MRRMGHGRCQVCVREVVRAMMGAGCPRRCPSTRSRRPGVTGPSAGAPEPARPMAAVTSIMRAQQILLARLNDLVAPAGPHVPALRGADAAVVHAPRRAAAGQGRRAPPGPPHLGDEHRRQARGRRPGAPRAPRGGPARDAGRDHAGGPPRRPPPRPTRCTPPGSASARSTTGSSRRSPRSSAPCASTPATTAPNLRSVPDTRKSEHLHGHAREDQADQHPDDRRGVARGLRADARARRRRSPRSAALPIEPLYTEADLPDAARDRRARRLSVHPRRVPEHVPGPPVDDAPVRRLRHRRGDQRALPLPARPRPDRPEHRVRHALADGPRLRLARARWARSGARASRSTRSTTCRRSSRASTSARSACR